MNYFHLSLLCLLLVFSFPPTQSSSSLGYGLFSSELVFNSTDIAYPSDWICTGTYKRLQACQGDIFLGRFAVKDTVTRIYDNLPPHSKLKFSFKLYMIDSWDDEYFQLYVDGTLVYSKVRSWANQQDGNFSCGPWKDAANIQFYLDIVVDVVVEIDHSKTDLTLVFTSTLDSDVNDESWAISHFSMQLLGCVNECTTCTTTSPLDSCKECLQRTMIQTSLVTNDKSCVKCHDSCKSCFSDGSNQCSSCFENAGLDTYKHCVCNNGFYLQGLTPYQCLPGFVGNDSEGVIMNEYLSNVTVLHYCDISSTSFMTTVTVQISPKAISKDILKLSVTIITDKSEIIMNYTATVSDQFTNLLLSFSFNDMVNNGCKESLSADVDSYDCYVRMAFIYQDSIQAIYEFHVISNMNRNLNQTAVITTNINKLKTNCLRNSCVNTFTPTSSLMICETADCTKKRSSSLFTRGDKISMLHSLDDSNLQSIYALEMASVQLTTGSGLTLNEGSSCSVTKQNSSLVYTCTLDLADLVGSRIQVTSKLTPIPKRILTEVNENNYNLTDFVIQDESISFFVQNQSTNGADRLKGFTMICILVILMFCF